ncbi:MAG: 2-C-methyl-D-erythritol 4-phosphate cytidylyltransferase [Arenicella sp.]|jgi:2-C-methyl-D-erythritol 4-phosphate cytidylyltransferase
MGGTTPKQFLLLNNRPIIHHSINAFVNVYPEIEVIVVLNEEMHEAWRTLNKEHNFSLHVILVTGGAERFQSIKNGLEKCSGDVIAIHDAVRPLVSSKVIEACFDAADVSGAAIPVMPIKPSLRKITFDESEAADRSLYREVQTPQVFKSNIIKMAYEQSFKAEFTDDATVVESCGHDIVLVDGNEENIKITTPFDLKVAESLL